MYSALSSMRIASTSSCLTCCCDGCVTGGSHPRSSFDHAFRADMDRWRDFDAKRTGGFQVYAQFKLGRQLDRQIRGLLPFDDAIDITCRAAEQVARVGAIAEQRAGRNKFRLLGHDSDTGL